MDVESNVRLLCFAGSLIVHIGHARILSIYAHDQSAICLVNVYDGLNAFGRMIVSLGSAATIGTFYPMTKGAKCNEGIYVEGGCPTTITTIEYEPIWTGSDKE